MLVGHFAVGLLAKRVEPKLSLGTLVLAAMVADFLWAIFLIAGIEHVQFKPGMGAANYIASFDVPFQPQSVDGCDLGGTSQQPIS